MLPESGSKSNSWRSVIVKTAQQLAFTWVKASSKLVIWNISSSQENQQFHSFLGLFCGRHGLKLVSLIFTWLYTSMNYTSCQAFAIALAISCKSLASRMARCQQNVIKRKLKSQYLLMCFKAHFKYSSHSLSNTLFYQVHNHLFTVLSNVY